VLLAIVLLTVVIAFYLSKKKKEKELWLMEKKLLQTDLQNKELAHRELHMEISFKTKQLTTHALNMIQRNQILTELREKLKRLSKRITDDLTMDFVSIIKDINQMQRTEKDWELFKKYFENINKDFNQNLRRINPRLSVNDYRLAALISLNLNIKEAAAVLNISPSSVKLARHRLRKKLGLHTGDDFYVFLNKL
jgi:DNA-binding CsgD family transcriptional regulator